MKKQLLFIVALCISAIVSGQVIDQPYNFPIKPGSIEWNALKSTEERVKACLIPDNILNKLSTKALVQTCLDYPFFVDVFAANNIHEGLKSVSLHFNGLLELTKRSDAGEALISIYSSLSPTHLDSSWTLLQQGNYVLNFTYCELLLSQNTIIERLSTEEKYLLIKEAVKKIEAKQNISAFGSFGLNLPSIIIGKIIVSVSRRSDQLLKLVDEIELNRFLKSGLYSDIKTLQFILEAGKAFRL